MLQPRRITWIEVRDALGHIKQRAFLPGSILLLSLCVEGFWLFMLPFRLLFLACFPLFIVLRRATCTRCIQITHSKYCPQFSSMDVESLPDAHDTPAFDKAFASKLTESTSDCPKLHTPDTAPRYMQTLLCTFYASSCFKNNSKPVCRKTCEAYTQDLRTLGETICPNSKRVETLIHQYKPLCTSNRYYNGTEGSCIAGEDNEPNSCGKHLCALVSLDRILIVTWLGYHSPSARCKFCKDSKDTCCTASMVAACRFTSKSSSAEKVNEKKALPVQTTVIVGAVLGGVGVLLLIGVVIMLIQKRLKRKQAFPKHGQIGSSFR
jgi:hypothetical protein